MIGEQRTESREQRVQRTESREQRVQRTESRGLDGQKARSQQRASNATSVESPAASTLPLCIYSTRKRGPQQALEPPALDKVGTKSIVRHR